MASNIKRLLTAVYDGSMSHRQMQQAFQCSPRTIQNCKQLIDDHNLTADKIAALSDAEITALLPDKRRTRTNDSYLPPDVEAIHRKAAKHDKTFTLRYEWETYLHQAEKAGCKAYSYAQFCRKVTAFVDVNKLTQTLTHAPGFELQVDWAGTKILYGHLDDPAKASIFVASLPHSGLIFATATKDEKLPAWLDCHRQALEYIGGVPATVTPDNTSTATLMWAADKRLRVINPNYQAFAAHYGFGITPARPHRPTDKGHVENAVKIVTTRIIAVLQQQWFTTLDDLNTRLRILVDDLNTTPMTNNISRAELFDDFERESLGRLPDIAWTNCTWAKAIVGHNYHIRYDKQNYSVPYALVGKTVKIQATDTTITIYCEGSEVARHSRCTGRQGSFTTDIAHMPDAHQQTRSHWSRKSLIGRARRFGPHTEAVITQLLNGVDHEAQAYHACDNILKLGRNKKLHRLEDVCADLIATNTPASFTRIDALMRRTTPPPAARPRPQAGKANRHGTLHHGLRGADAFTLPTTQPTANTNPAADQAKDNHDD
ncbi:IS21 family transposase [Corynebacterium aquilae]|uniref:Integrase catalytic domain-containing protein n=1 Tax=Corynebacterium aquilae DSM 44791 TaxID=1431546 RepID=A0A1L7CIG6_9CORY|nr:IS21 family transposase [Corynebacterium aquilae]APT85203.1 hypothetical protein CAQU_09100 [Corynebacterium aquilae DSM 44791]APT85650.1 hypothetical protein CAQU_12050 [Corynebacterium aquilae DSM 44791]